MNRLIAAAFVLGRCRRRQRHAAGAARPAPIATSSRSPADAARAGTAAPMAAAAATTPTRRACLPARLTSAPTAAAAATAGEVLSQNDIASRAAGWKVRRFLLASEQSLNVVPAKAASRVGKGALAPCPPFLAKRHPEWWARGACHRARIRATRWLCPRYELIRVIASGAKQSMSPLAEEWIASSHSLLAMTVDTVSHSRGTMSPRFARTLSPPKQRAQGRPGVRGTRGPLCKMHKKHAHEHTVQRKARRPTPDGIFLTSPNQTSFYDECVARGGRGAAQRADPHYRNHLGARRQQQGVKTGEEVRPSRNHIHPRPG